MWYVRRLQFCLSPGFWAQWTEECRSSIVYLHHQYALADTLLFAIFVLIGPLVTPGGAVKGQALLGSLLLPEGSHGAQEPGRGDQCTDH